MEDIFKKAGEVLKKHIEDNPEQVRKDLEEMRKMSNNLEPMEDKTKTAEEIFKKHYESRSGKKADEVVMDHMSYCINAMKEYASQKWVSVEDKTMELMKMVLSSYKVINTTDDYRRIYLEIVAQCEILHNKMIEQPLPNPPKQ